MDAEERCATVGGYGARIAVGGDSAGGNIAAALPLKARDPGLPVPPAPERRAPLTAFFFAQYESLERPRRVGLSPGQGWEARERAGGARAGALVAFRVSSEDMGGGRWGGEEPLANRVRSGRKQP